MPYISAFRANFINNYGSQDTCNVFINGTCNIFGYLNVNSNVVFSNSLGTSGNATIGQNLTIGGNIFLNQNLNVLGLTNLINLVTISSNIANTYGNVALTGNLVTTNVFCTNVITQSNISNTYGNVAITGNLVTTNVFCTNVITQSNISNTYGNVAITGNLVTTNVFCTNVITQGNISNVTGTVAITGNAVVESNLQCSNLLVTGAIDNIFQFVGSTYYQMDSQTSINTAIVSGSEFAISHIDFTLFSTPSNISYYIAPTTSNGNITFLQPGAYKLNGILSTDGAIYRIGYVIGDLTRNQVNSLIVSDCTYLYEFDVTAQPTVPFTIPIIVSGVTTVTFIFYSYAGQPSVYYFPTLSSGTYLAIGIL